MERICNTPITQFIEWNLCASVVKLVNTADLKSADRKVLPVQVRPDAPFSQFLLVSFPRDLKLFFECNRLRHFMSYICRRFIILRYQK